MRRIDDSCLYDPDAIMVGLLLFKPHVCSACGETLPRNIDYFNVDAHAADGMRGYCRRCRRLQLAAGGRRRYAARMTREKVAS